MEKIAVQSLKNWFIAERRDLPWRGLPSPYHVWISEVMLQQTQVAVVIPYFHRWMEQFPTIAHLASAPIQQVIKAWEGLGYYSRARNLHAAAQYLMQHCNGQLPSSREELLKIKGIGPYTVGAILSFAFHQKAAAVDGNVARVLSRYYVIEEAITQPKMQTLLRERVEKILPDQEPWIVMEGLIELGAKICAKVPQCGKCPLRSSCLGHLTEKAPFLPNRGKKVSYVVLERKAVVLMSGDEILLSKGKPGQVMADLYEFPTFDPLDMPQLEAVHTQDLGTIKYTYTCHRVILIPSIWEVKKQDVEGYVWVRLEEARSLPFSSGHRRLLAKLFSL